MRKRLGTGILAGAALAALLATTGCTLNVTTTNQPPSTITITGVGSVNASPDQARLTFAVDARAKTRSGAMNSTSKAVERIVSALKKAGAEDSEIQTLQVNLNPRRDRQGKVTGYQTNQSIAVTTKKLAKLGDMIAAGTNAGAVDVSGPSYMMTSENPARDAVIAKAMDDAKARGAQMAKSAGRNLGGVVTVKEASANVPQPYFNSYQGVGEAFGKARYLIAGVPMQPGTSEVQASLTVVYSLE